MKIILSGGYTLGPVTPLLAIYEVLKKKYPQAEFLWVGTKNGPEKKLVEEKNIRFISLASGKMRRYLSWWNIVDMFRLIVGFFQSLKLIWQTDPQILISAGGFISVPLHWAGWILNVPQWIHQQDVVVGLANKLMAPFASVITTSLESNAKKFNAKPFGKLRVKKTVWLGNPMRQEIFEGNRVEGMKLFNLNPDLPVVLATGGGTGSLRVNQLIVESIQHLNGFCQVIHLTGTDRPQELVERALKHFKDYYQIHQFFTSEMKLAYAVADIVISRGGFGTLTEIAGLGKVGIIIPKPGHQEENVKFLAEACAIELVDERTADGNYLAKVIKDLLADKIKQKQLSRQLQKMLPIASEENILAVFEKVIK